MLLKIQSVKFQVFWTVFTGFIRICFENMILRASIMYTDGKFLVCKDSVDNDRHFDGSIVSNEIERKLSFFLFNFNWSLFCETDHEVILVQMDCAGQYVL